MQPTRPGKVWIIAIIFALLVGCSRFALPAQSPAPTATALAAARSSQPVPAPTTPAATLTLAPSPLPTASQTLAPSRTPAPTGCLDSLEIVLRQGLAESSPAALQALPAGTPGEAIWRVRNTGTCTWDRSYALVSLDGSAPHFVQRTIKPGELLDLSVHLAVPAGPGPQTLLWELRNGRGQRVGSPLAVNLLVADVPVPTLPPGLVLRAYPEVIQPDDRTTLSWDVQAAREVYFYRPGQRWQSYPVEARGSVIDFPRRSTTYELRVVRGDDSIEIYRVRVEVTAYDPPKIVYLRPQALGTATPDACVALEWATRGRVNLVVITRNGTPFFTGNRDRATGVLRDCPVGRGPFVYTLLVFGPGGEDQASCTYGGR